MTALAVAEAEIAAEGPLAGVTRRARLSAGIDEMLRGRGRTHLTRLRRARGEFVTVNAVESLAGAVVRVAEGVPKRARVGVGGLIGFLIVADATRSDLAAVIRFAGWRVTRVAVAVRGEICGNRKPGAPIHGRAMTTSATVRRTRRASVVLRVIELHVEGFVEARRKVLQRWIVALRVGVANQAHRDRGRRELAAMAVGASLVTGKARSGGVVGAFVTRVAGE